jgi:hypothetical protein
MTGKLIILTTRLVFQVFLDDNASVVKNAVFHVVPVCEHRLTTAWLMFKIHNS